MAEDWAAVARAIKDRRKELGISQIELGRRADVSKQIIGELENNKARDNRRRRTLAAVSVALGWHPEHLAAVLAGRMPPRLGEPVPFSDDDIPGHISVLEYYLRQLVDEVQAVHGRLDDLNAKIDAVDQRSCSERDA